MPTKYTLEVHGGRLTPDIRALRDAMSVLKREIKSDPILRRSWASNPRTVLADRGLNRVLQNQILQEEGKAVRWSGGDKAAAAGCYGCTGCCCTGCCVTSINLSDNVSNPAR